MKKCPGSRFKVKQDKIMVRVGCRNELLLLKKAIMKALPNRTWPRDVFVPTTRHTQWPAWLKLGQSNRFDYLHRLGYGVDVRAWRMEGFKEMSLGKALEFFGFRNTKRRADVW